MGPSCYSSLNITVCGHGSFMLFLLKYYSVWSWVLHAIPPKILHVCGHESVIIVTILHVPLPLNCTLYIGKAMKENPGYLKLRQIRAAQHIAHTLAQSQNRVYLSSDSLMINLRDMVKVKVSV